MLETFSGLDVLLNGALLGRNGINTATNLIVVCRGCQTTLQSNATPASALSRYTLHDMFPMMNNFSSVYKIDVG